MAATFEKVKAILTEQLGVDENAITENTAIEELGADSLDLVEIVMTIEEEFDIKIDDSVIEDLKKVGDIITYIEQR